MGISIHALRVEGDDDRHTVRALLAFISIHALRVEGDCCREYGIYVSGEFLSTPSGWRATAARDLDQWQRFVISIHALRVEGDSGVDGDVRRD